MNDLLDLCRLNLLEERVTKSSAVDREATLAAIDFKLRQLATAVTNNPPTLALDAMERHRKDNTAEDGTYPWTDSPQFRAAEETNGASAAALGSTGGVIRTALGTRPSAPEHSLGAGGTTGCA